MTVMRDKIELEYERIVSGMDLRPPQRKSLEMLRDLLVSMPKGINELAPAEIASRVNRENPTWTFPEGFTMLTFALATGVGKTRLMGALMALLYRSGQCRNFVLLAPRDAVLRKLLTESRAASPKYIFVEPSIVPQPKVCHRGNLLEFDPGHPEGLFAHGPNVFILSPQLLTTDGRIRQRSGLTGISVLEYLQSCPDLVVFIDESHHLSTRDDDGDASVWGNAVRQLKPKMCLAMTATPKSTENVAYEYSLRQCLQEGLYTKRVRLLVHEREENLSDSEFDTFVLRAGLERLEEKRKALDLVRVTRPAFPKVEAVMLVCARNQNHADQVGDWLAQEGGLQPDEVLVIHAERKSEADLTRLQELERATNAVRVVVQVHVLDEGWDVTNVYVITPLKYSGSFSNAKQVMGRGLRLPMGYRVANDEVDRLDVLSFGGDSFEQVYSEAAADFGDPNFSSIEIVREGEAAPPRGSVASADRAPAPGMKRIEIPIRIGRSCQIPYLDIEPPAIDVGAAAVGKLETANLRTLELGTLLAGSVSSRASLPASLVAELIVDQVLRDFDALSAPLHEEAIKGLVDQILRPLLSPGQTSLAIDHTLMANQIVGSLRSSCYTKPPQYRATGGTKNVELMPYEAWIAESLRGPADARTISWTKQTHARLPCEGWRSCTHVAACFDTAPEFELARRLDGMEGIVAWLRNDPKQVLVPTLYRQNYAPDFIVWLREGLHEKILLLEMKGEHLWSEPGSEARINARDLRLWAAEANRSLEQTIFETIVILSHDVNTARTLADLRQRDRTEAWNASI